MKTIQKYLKREDMEKSLFVKVLGDYPLIRALDFLITFRAFDYSLTDIAKNSDVGWSTIHEFWPQLVALGIVKKTRKVGNAQMYKLNLENSTVQKLIELDEDIIYCYGSGPKKPRQKSNELELEEQGYKVRVGKHKSYG